MNMERDKNLWIFTPFSGHIFSPDGWNGAWRLHLTMGGELPMLSQWRGECKRGKWNQFASRILICEFNHPLILGFDDGFNHPLILPHWFCEFNPINHPFNHPKCSGFNDQWGLSGVGAMLPWAWPETGYPRYPQFSNGPMVSFPHLHCKDSLRYLTWQGKIHKHPLYMEVSRENDRTHWGIFQLAMFDYQRVHRYSYHDQSLFLDIKHYFPVKPTKSKWYSH